MRLFDAIRKRAITCEVELLDDLVSMPPLTLKFSDDNQVERIAYPLCKVSAGLVEASVGFQN